MKRVIIVGGGFAGSTVARNLEGKFEVIIVDSKKYFEFTPGILRVLVEPEHKKKIQIFHKDYLKKSKIIIGIFKKIKNNFILVDNKLVRFDYLVITTGSKLVPSKEKNNIVKPESADILSKINRRLEHSEKILIVGGGITGVELASEIATKYNKEVFLIHSKERLLEKLPIGISKYATNFLLSKGVKLFFNERFYRGKKFFQTDKRKIKADIVFLCTGVTPNKLSKKDFITERGLIKINKFLQVENHKNIFAAGDIIFVSEEKTAQNAKNQGELISENISLIEKGKELKRYNPKLKIMVISLGKWNGILYYKNFYLTGIVPGIFKTLIEKWHMLSYKFGIKCLSA